MLTLTQDATKAIERILDAPGMPDSAGIRIGSAAPGLVIDSASPMPGVLQLTLAEEPEIGDEVIDQAGARVFVEGTVVSLLAEELLDVELVGERLQFTFVPSVMVRAETPEQPPMPDPDQEPVELPDEPEITPGDKPDMPPVTPSEPEQEPATSPVGRRGTWPLTQAG